MATKVQEGNFCIEVLTKANKSYGGLTIMETRGGQSLLVDDVIKYDYTLNDVQDLIDKKFLELSVPINAFRQDSGPNNPAIFFGATITPPGKTYLFEYNKEDNKKEFEIKLQKWMIKITLVAAIVSALVTGLVNWLMK